MLDYNFHIAINFGPSVNETGKKNAILNMLIMI